MSKRRAYSGFFLGGRGGRAFAKVSLLVAMVTCRFVPPPSPSPFRDPNRGLDVPVTWPTFDSVNHHYLEINSKMNRDYVRQRMRMRYVHFWGSVLPQLSFLQSV